MTGSSSVHLARLGQMMPPPPLPSSASVKTTAVVTSTNKQPWPKRGSLTAAGSGLNISCPGNSVISALKLPQSFTNLPPNPGYTLAHERYDEMRNWFAHRAYNPYHELIVVKVWMAYKKPGNRGPSLVSVCPIIICFNSLTIMIIEYI